MCLSGMSTGSLYDRLGGREGIGTVVDEFYDRILDDDRITGLFEDIDMGRLWNHQTLFISSVAGGPVEYTGREIQSAHDDLGTTGDDFGIVAVHLEDTFGDAGVEEGDIERVMGEIADLKADVVAD